MPKGKIRIDGMQETRCVAHVLERIRYGLSISTGCNATAEYTHVGGGHCWICPETGTHQELRMQPDYASESHVAGRAEVHAAGHRIEECLLRRKKKTRFCWVWLNAPLFLATYEQRLTDEAIRSIREAVTNE